MTGGAERPGPLRGVRVVEVAGIGPGPHAATILADLGADVVRVERPGGAGSPGPREVDLLTRGRPSVALDLKHPDAVAALLRMVESADLFLEGMRPGAAERLGIGTEACHARNPRLVYGRMTGWGQTGPWATTAGHDLTFLALSGALHGLGQDPARPHFPTNLLGDFGGGSTYLVIGLLAGLLESRVSGRGQVVDAAILDGVGHLSAFTAGLLAGGAVQERRGTGVLDGAAPYYDLYETADGGHLAVAPLEPQFFAELLDRLGLTGQVPGQDDVDQWPELRAALAARIAERTRDEWAAVLDGTDACAAPVLTPSEAAAHPQLAARGVWVEREGLRQPAPAPRFSRTPGALSTGPSVPGADTSSALAAWGVDDVAGLLASGAAVQA